MRLIRILPGLILVLLCLGATSKPAPLATLHDLPSPADPGGAEPYLSVSPQGVVWLSWVDKRAAGGHVFRAAPLDSTRWGAPVTIAEGDSIVASWADFPTLLPLGGNRLAAQYLWRTGSEPDAHEVRVTQSEDGGHLWSAPVVPHRDGTPTEHGFVTLLRDTGGVRAIWLDGRNAMTIDSAGRPVHLEEGASDMTLRTAVIRADGTISSEALIDPRVCDCCQTSAVTTSGGAVVAYRDRSAAETRDISVAVLANGAWSEPANVHADGWKINGCPVNGPALASMSQRFGSIVLRTVAAAWFSAARDTARVLFASSNDGGRSFGPAIRLDGGAPSGRVSMLFDGSGAAWVMWLETRGKEALIQLRRVARDGALGAPITVARMPAARSGGFPRMARSGDQFVFAWTEAGTPGRLRTATARISGGAKP